MTVDAAETKLLRAADETRRGRKALTPYELWQLADRESAGVQTRRLTLYRHAMIHAGYIVPAATEEPFEVCPLCKAPLETGK